MHFYTILFIHKTLSEFHCMDPVNGRRTKTIAAVTAYNIRVKFSRDMTYRESDTTTPPEREERRSLRRVLQTEQLCVPR